MGKMLSECEDHLAMDSLVYHYLFIERHTMIDNVVKNTFWSSSVDSKYQIWDLAKDYDNDTADGNDNNGKLTIDYGFEGLDTRLSNMSDLADNVENAIKTSTLFNGAEFCSWYNFIYNLMPYLKNNTDITPYSNLATNDKWGINGEIYLNKCKKWQDMIPEICWILDAYRKYKRPYEIYQDASYLPRLEGGKKTYQRVAFETYQCNYLNSKYLNNSGGILARLSYEQNTHTVIPIKFYQKGYLQSRIGGVLQPSQRVTDINKFYYLKIPETSGGDEIIFNLYYTFLFAEIGQENDYGLILENNNYRPATEDEYYEESLIKYYSTLASLRAQSWAFDTATKLTSLIMSNNFDIKKEQFSPHTGSINFSDNSLIKKLIIKNFQPNSGVSQGNVNHVAIQLDKLHRLKYLDLTDTKCNAIVLADNIPLDTLILNNPESLTLTNLYKLSSIEYSSISNLNTLLLNNVDNKRLLSYDLLEEAINLKSYELQNIYWNLNKQYFRDNNEMINNEHIYILDELLNEHTTQYEYVKSGEPIQPTDLLSGTIQIDSDLYSGNNSLYLYNKYILGIAENWDSTKYFKNLKLEFLSPNSKLYNFYIYNGDGSILWEKSFSQLTDIESAFFDRGKKLNGLGNYSYEEIRKNETLEKVYLKNNHWTIKINGENVIQNQEINNLTEFNFTQFNTYPLGNIECIPKFEESDRLFNINIVTQDEDGNNLNVETLQLKYHSSLNDIIEAIRWIPYRIKKNEEIHTVQKWSGLSSINNGNPLSAYTVISDKTLYPVFEEIPDITESSWEFDKQYFNFNSYLNNTKSINPKPEYTLNGKIVLPSTDIDNNEVVAIGSFNGQTKITHILFNNLFSTKLQAISNSAFSNLQSLEYFDFNHFEEGIESIGDYAFSNIGNLKNSNFNCIIQNIGQQSFRAALNDQITNLEIADIQELGVQAFANNPGLTGTLIWSQFNLDKWIQMRSIYRGSNNYRIFALSSNQPAKIQSLNITFDHKNQNFPSDYQESVFISDLIIILGLKNDVSITISKE